MPDINRNVANPAGEDEILAGNRLHSRPGLRPGQDHFIAETDETGLGAVDAVADESAPASMWGEAWRNLRRRPLFWVSAVLILIAVVMSLFPQLFTSVDPRACMLSNSLGDPQPGHPLLIGRDDRRLPVGDGYPGERRARSFLGNGQVRHIGLQSDRVLALAGVWHSIGWTMSRTHHCDRSPQRRKPECIGAAIVTHDANVSCCDLRTHNRCAIRLQNRTD